MSCCIELVQVTTTAPVVQAPGPAPVIRLRSVTATVTGQARAAVILPNVTIAVIGGTTSSGGTGGGGGPSTTRWEILTDGAMGLIWAGNDLVYVEVPV